MIRRFACRNTRSMAGAISRSGVVNPAHLGVGRVGEEEVDALLPEPRERAQVGEPAVQRQLVHLEVAGVQQRAGRRADHDGQRVGDRVVDRDELEVEDAELLPRPLLDRQRIRGEAVLLELGLDEGEGQLRADDRDVGLALQQERHRADVVLVAVGEDDGLDLVEPAVEVLEVGQDQVDPRVVVLREEHAAVDDQQAALGLEDGHVAANLPETSEGDDAQGVAGDGWRVGEVGQGDGHGVVRVLWSGGTTAGMCLRSSGRRSTRPVRRAASPGAPAATRRAADGRRPSR